MADSTDDYVYFLGGYDLEMLTIRELLLNSAPQRLVDKQLSWGAAASDYKEALSDCFTAGSTAVLIELSLDLDLPKDKIVIVDHHNERAGTNQPTALHQVFLLLGLPKTSWTRWYDLVAANDRGHIDALVEMGASEAEIRKIRAADRAAQGVTGDDEAEVARAIGGRTEMADGRLTVVTVAHNRSSIVADLMDERLGGVGFQNLFVVCPDELAFYGAGLWVQTLKTQFPGGWYGGDLPVAGYWGINTSDHAFVTQVIEYVKAKM